VPILRRLQLYMLAFGCLMGAIFPVYASFFVDYKPGLRAWFVVGCLVAGVMVGVIAWVLVRQILLHRLQGMLVERLSREARTVQAMSGRALDLSHGLSRSVADQGAALARASAAADTLEAAVQKNEASVDASVKVAKASEQAGARGGEATRQVRSTIGALGESSGQMLSVLEEQQRELGKVGEIFEAVFERAKVINKIVAQTRLLALNAAIEAARAGQAGAGFAVVAHEVGVLAQSSGSTADEISSLLASTREQFASLSQRARQRMDEAAAQARAGMAGGEQAAAGCEASLGDLAQRAGEAGGLLSQISAATREQSRGLGEIAQSIHRLQGSGAQSEAAAKASEESAQSLATQAEALGQLVEDFVGLVDPDHKHGAPTELAQGGGTLLAAR
jgi:methyl-accepting chemotaxis protein